MDNSFTFRNKIKKAVFMKTTKNFTNSKEGLKMRNTSNDNSIPHRSIMINSTPKGLL
jgi:hypothetical protein